MKNKTKSELLAEMRMLEENLKASHFLTIARFVHILTTLLETAKKESD